ncbi:MAG: cytochrome c biogenesis CcdA family protein [Ilumatobacteraceae bacterium]|nr:cytochrome c biogenesis protein CcdA [Acidimicrobiales bacterium]MCB9393666.1 cytochrome c biogenesis protein CcdA [Acidimicrobiaceae bacterium]
MNLSYSLIVGMVATVNPCGFVLLPTYLMYFLGISSSEAGRQRASISRALLVSGAVSAGFVLVFLVVGSITRFFTDWVAANAKYATGAIGLVFVVLGVAMLFGYKLPISTPKLDAGGKDRTVQSMFVYGIAYAVASIGCTLPLFSVVLFGTANREGYAAGIANVAAYGAGMALVVTALTVSLSVANTGLMKWLRSGMQYVEMLSGAFVLIAGAYLLWYFWKVDVQGETDPITDAVQRWQNDIQVFLNDHWQPVATVMLLVIVAAVAATLIGRRHRPPQLPPGAE